MQIAQIRTRRSRLQTGRAIRWGRPSRSGCERFPAECAVDLSEPAALELSATAWAKIEAVNKIVNSSVKPMVDMEHWGVVDHWDFPDDGYGDCEDYQLLKRELLAEMGFPRRAMRMTVVLDEAGEGHAVPMILNRSRRVVISSLSVSRSWMTCSSSPTICPRPSQIDKSQ